MSKANTDEVRTFPFTDPKLKSLTVGSGRTSYYDSKLTGLAIRVSHTGRKIFELYYRVKDQKGSRRIDLGPYPAITLADARELAKAKLLDAARGIDPAIERRATKEAPSFGELAEDFIELYAKKRKRTWKSDENILKKDVLPNWRRRKAVDIKRRDVIDLLDDIAGRAPIQANRTLAVIRKLFNWAISRDIVEANPCSQVQAPSKENERDRVLSEQEIKALWDACGKIGGPWGDAIKIMLVTAQRRGEVMTMRWQDVDLDGGWWTVPAAKAKNDLSHRVYLSDLAKSVLRARKGGTSQWVFESPRKQLDLATNALVARSISNPNSTTETIRKHMAEKLKVPKVDVKLHDLRRTAASNMTSMGFDRLRHVAKVLNHVEPGVTKVYDRHSYDAEKREVLEAWAAKLEKIIAS